MKGSIVMGLALGLALLPLAAKAGEDASKMPAEFERMKSLVGTWTGKAKMHGDKEESVKVTYALTSGGTVVMERLNPGTSHEMVSMYNMEGGKLCMTHYCSLGNSPKMTLKKVTEDGLAFEMKGKTGIASSKEMHMHALNLTWKDADHITAEWIAYRDGKAAPAHPFVLTRKK